MLAYVNGSIIPGEKAVISINDRGWLYGDSVFETMRTYSGRVYKAMDHFERLRQSAELVGINLPMSDLEMSEQVDSLLEAQAPTSDVAIRVTVSRGVGGAGLYPSEAPQPTVVIQLRDLPYYPPVTFTKGWSLVIAKTQRNDTAAINPRIKSANFLNNVMAKREAVEAGVDDALMLNKDGFITESTGSNFFMVRGDELVTPAVSDGILAGITRQLVLDIGKAAGLDVREESIRPEELQNGQEAFLTLTSAGIIPIIRINDLTFGSGMGPVTAKLRRLYEREIENFLKG